MFESKAFNRVKNRKEYERELTALIQRISHDQRFLREFLVDLLSPTEYREIVLRWQIVKELYRGVSQRQIAKNLHVSIATITRGSRELLDGGGGFQKVLKRFYSQASE